MQKKVSSIAVQAIALSLSACSAAPYLGASVTATDVHYVEFDRDAGRTVAAPRNPFGSVAAGVEWQPAPAWRIDFDVSHTSSLRTGNDRGTNAVSLSARWYPF